MSTVTDYLEIATSGTGLIHAASGYYVQLRSQTGGSTYTSVAVTDSTGYYTLTGVPPDSYEIWYSTSLAGPWTDSGKTQYVPVSRPWFDVIAYGADRTGVSDSAGAINSAIAAAAGVGTAFIPAGTYLINSQLLLHSNTTLLMDRQAYLKRNFAGAGTISTASGSSNISIIGGNLGLSGSLPAGQHITLINCTDVRIEDVFIGNTVSTAYMVWLYGVTNCVIHNCVLDNPSTGVLTNDGIHLDGGTNVTISDCYVSTGDDAIVLGNQGSTVGISNVVISNCAVYSGGARGVSIYAGSVSYTVSKVSVENVVGSALGGLLVWNLADTSQTRITDVSFTNCQIIGASYGLWVRVASDVCVQGCTFRGSTTSFFDGVTTNPGTGASLRNATGVRLVNNTIKGNTQGIQELGTSTNNLFASNDLRTNTTTVVPLVGSTSRFANNLGYNEESSLQTVATGNTINTAGISVARTTAAAAVTGVILQSGTFPGQEVTVVNEGSAANTIAFAVAGTSHVADGATPTIAGLTARKFVWDTGTSLWYRVT